MKHSLKSVAVAVAVTGAGFFYDAAENSAQAACGTEDYLGSVCTVAFNFCPRGTAAANGQLLAISSNTPLFALIGTFYGGDGRTTFALPDLRGRSSVGMGTGPGLSPVSIGQKRGAERITQAVTQMPSHSHAATFTPSGGGAAVKVEVSTVAGTKQTAVAGDYLAAGTAGTRTQAMIYLPAADKGVTVALGGVSGGGGGGGAVAVGKTGGGVATSNLPPQLALKNCIVTQGVFPPRS